MKYFSRSGIKSIFFRLRLDIILNFLSYPFLFFSYLTKLSRWISQHKKVAYNDFPCSPDYERRYPFYKWVIETENLKEGINYLEFGVASGQSFKWFLNQNANENSRFYGFDTFDGLPEDWGPFKKGAFSNNNQLPQISDVRGRFFQGLFQQTLPAFLKNFDNTKRNVLLMDADLYTATLYVLTSLAPYLKKGDIIFFDEFTVPLHEFKAYLDFTSSYYINLQLIAAANNYYFAAFKVV